MNAIASDKIGINIKKKILETGLSIHALEKKAGLKPSAVQNILYGKSKKPSLYLIQSIAQVLSCTVSELLEEVAVHPSQRGIEERKASSQIEPWNTDLYVETLNVVNLLSKKKKIALTRDKFLACGEEVYLYSLKTENVKADRTFAEWLIDRSSS